MNEILTFNDFVRFLLRNKWLFVSTIISVVSLAIVLMFILPPKYKASSNLILIDSPAANPMSAKLGGLANFVAPKLGLGSEDLNKVELLLNSSRFILQAVDSLQIKSMIYPTMWDSSTNEWRDGVKKPNLQLVVDRFKSEIFTTKIDFEKNTLNVTATMSNPESAKELLASYIGFVNRYLIRRNTKEVERNISFLTQKLTETPNMSLQKELVELLRHEYSSLMMANRPVFEKVDDPLTPYVRSFPKRKVMLAAAIAVGVFLGFLVAIFLEWYRSFKLGKNAN